MSSLIPSRPSEVHAFRTWAVAPRDRESRSPFPISKKQHHVKFIESLLEVGEDLQGAIGYVMVSVVRIRASEIWICGEV